MNIEYAIIVKNKTRLEALIERFNTKAQAKFYIESLGGNFEDYIQKLKKPKNENDKKLIENFKKVFNSYYNDEINHLEA